MPLTSPYHVPLINRILRPLLKAGLRGIFHVLASVHVRGQDNVPPRPYVIAMNHISILYLLTRAERAG